MLKQKLAQILAVNVRRLRKAKGYSQESFAVACGLHRTYVGAIERAEYNVTLQTLEALAKALDISVPELLTPIN
jgi:transcriptional regulator with XRE-family HTH domain